MDAAEFNRFAEAIIDDLRPAFDARWAAFIDGEVAGGEHLVALDDALQAAALADYRIDAELTARVERVLDDLNPDSDDWDRINRWLSRIRPAAAL